jgi:hypothetical protein
MSLEGRQARSGVRSCPIPGAARMMVEFGATSKAGGD